MNGDKLLQWDVRLNGALCSGMMIMLVAILHEQYLYQCLPTCLLETETVLDKIKIPAPARSEAAILDEFSHADTARKYICIYLAVPVCLVGSPIGFEPVGSMPALLLPIDYVCHIYHTLNLNVLRTLHSSLPSSQIW